MYEITYHPKVVDDLAKISKSELIRIHRTIEHKLRAKPEIYGTRLRGELKEYWKLRVGDYRAVFKIQTAHIFILAIRHRKEIYRISEGRG